MPQVSARRVAAIQTTFVATTCCKDIKDYHFSAFSFSTRSLSPLSEDGEISFTALLLAIWSAIALLNCPQNCQVWLRNWQAHWFDYDTHFSLGGTARSGPNPAHYPTSWKYVDTYIHNWRTLVNYLFWKVMHSSERIIFVLATHRPRTLTSHPSISTAALVATNHCCFPSHLKIQGFDVLKFS